MEEKRKKALIALKKAKSSLEKNIKMIEEDEKCNDIVVQNMACIWLIKSANNSLIEAFIELCQDDKKTKKQKIIELFKLSHK